MNRSEAVNLIKEIINVCEGLGEEGIMLMPPNSNNILSHGYQLHIKSRFQQQSMSCLIPIIQKHELAIASGNGQDLIIIYKPMKGTETRNPNIPA